MIKITNYCDTVIDIDDKRIFPGNFIIVNYVKDTFKLNTLINQRRITVTSVNMPKDDKVVSKINTVTHTTNTFKIVEPDVKQSSDNVSDDLDINTTTKKKKSKDNSEVENSKSTKGDMNNATD